MAVPATTPVPPAATPPALPPTATLDPNAPLPAEPNAAPPATPPLTITGSPIGGATPLPGLPLPGVAPTPVVLPPTVILTAEERTGDGFGPHLSVPNGVHAYSRAGLPPRNWIDQTQAEADAKSNGCLECHHGVEPMHRSKYVVLGCTDCHGGDAGKGAKDAVVDGAIPGHVKALYPEYWRTAANPAESSTILNHESPEFVRFVNPGDLRGGATGVRTVPRKELRARHQLHDERRPDALGRRALQQRRLLEKKLRVRAIRTAGTARRSVWTNPYARDGWR